MADNSQKALRKEIDQIKTDINSLRNEVHHDNNEFHRLLRAAPWEQPGTRIEPGPASAQEGDGAGRKIPFTPKIDPAPITAQRSSGSRYKTIEWWKPRLEIAAIFGGLFYALITYQQWHDANRNFRVDQRAWVKFEAESSPLHIAEGEGLRIPVRFVNTGKTSALNIRSRIVVQILRSDHEMPVPDPQQQLAFPGMPAAHDSYQVTDAGVNHIDSGITYPNDSSQAWVYLIGKSTKGEPTPRAMTEPEVTAMEHNLSYISIWGQAWYEDIFGNKHWTKFCTSMASAGPQTRSPKCARFNDVDR